MNNSIVVLVLPITIYFLTTCFELIPENLNNIDDLIEKFASTSYIIRILLMILVVLLYICYHFSTVLGKVKVFNQFDKIRESILTERASKLIDKYKRKGLNLRLNIFIAKRKIFVKNSPFLFQKQFRTIFHYNMDDCKDREIGLTTNQGVSGLAFNEPQGQQLYVDLEATDNRFNLNSDQIERTAGIKFVISTPILKWTHSTGKYTDQTIGVLNIDSRINSFSDLQSKVNSSEISKSCKDIAKVVSMMY